MEELDVKTLQSDLVNYDMYLLADEVPLREDLFLTVIGEEDTVLIELKEYTPDNKTYQAMSSMSKDKFLEATPEEFNNFINETYFYNMIEMEEF